MNIIDINAWLGSYPWRPLRNNDVQSLLRLMDQVGIRIAVVSSIEAIFRNNPQSGNLELHQQTAAWRERLVPFMTLNPTYAGWERDLAICHDDWHMRGIRAFPAHHGYALGDKACNALLAAAAERKLPVAFCVRLVDRRQHHWLDPTTDLDQTLLARTLAAHPDNQFMVLNHLAPVETWQLLTGHNVLFDISRVTAVDISLAPKNFNIPALIKAQSSSQFAFGSGMPFSVPQVAMLKLRILRIDSESLVAIAGGNAAAILGL